MNIIHIASQKNWGGGEKQVLYLLRELRKAKIDQILVCSQISALGDQASKEGFTVHRLAKPPLFAFFWALKIKNLAKNKTKTILHAHDAQAHSCALLASIFSVHQIPIVVHRRMIKQTQGFLRNYKFNHPAVKKIVCISSLVRETTRSMVQNQEKLVYIPSGIDLSEKLIIESNRHSILESLQLPNREHLIINIGSLTEQKNQMSFLRTAKIFLEKYPDLGAKSTFAIFGKGPQFENLKAFIRDNQMESHCFLVGFSQNIQEILSITSILISTAIGEALGNVIMEAFRSGVPVIAANSGGVIDLIEDQKTGFLITQDDESQFAATCFELLKHSDIFEKIKKNALAKIDDFSILKVGKDIQLIYQSLL